MKCKTPITICLALVTLFITGTALANVYNFDNDTVGLPPAGPWTFTGQGSYAVSDAASISGSQSLAINHWSSKTTLPMPVNNGDVTDFSVWIRTATTTSNYVDLGGINIFCEKQTDGYHEINYSIKFEKNISYDGENGSTSHSISWFVDGGRIASEGDFSQANWYHVQGHIDADSIDISILVDNDYTASHSFPLNGFNVSTIGLMGGTSSDTFYDDLVLPSAAPDCNALAARGDFNCDANVDLSDLVTLGENYNTTGLELAISYTLGDTNADGNVDLADLVTLGENYNTTITPEPGSLTLLATTLSLTFTRRRKI